MRAAEFGTPGGPVGVVDFATDTLSAKPRRRGGARAALFFVLLAAVAGAVYLTVEGLA
jgi:hypothetical protein